MKKYITSVIPGLAVGILTVAGQKFLPMNFNFLANSGAVWLVPAFLLSYLAKEKKGPSILLCMETLFFCVIGYYSFEAVLNQHSFSIGSWMMVWIAMSVIAGAIFGLGAYLAHASSGFLKYIGMNLLPAVFFSEGVWKLLHITDYKHMVPAVMIVTCIGLILYLAINRKEWYKLKNLMSFLVLSALGISGYSILSGMMF